MNETFIENVKKALRLYVDREHNGVTSQAEKALGLAEGSGLLSKWLKPRGDKGERVPSFLQIAPLFPQLGIRVFFPWEELPTESVDTRKLESEIHRLNIELAKKDGAIEALNARLDRYETVAEKENTMTAPASAK